MANKIHDLVQRLIDRTDSGKVNWEVTENRGVYQASFPNYAVRLSSHQNWNNEIDYTLAIHDENGEMVDQVTDVDLKDTGFTAAFNQMQRLYNEARRKAMGVDQVIDDLMSELGE